jgi:hypothetical protein
MLQSPERLGKMFKQNTHFEILTPLGFQPFEGINKTTHQRSVTIMCSNGEHLTCSLDHPLIVDGQQIMAKNISIGTMLTTVDGHTHVTDIVYADISDEFYDPINVSGGYTYYSNSIVSHNCQFISNDPLLIDPRTLENMKLNIKAPIAEIKEVKFWKQPKSNLTYLVGMDPATGTGADFTTITVFEFPSLEQVAEWRSNTMSSAKAYQVLKNVIALFERAGSQVYFSVENNGVGEGIIALYDADETQSINAEFISETGKENRGIRSTPRSKMRACLSFKEMLEKGQFTIRSKILHTELKEFIRSGPGYEAREGSTDDLVCSCLIVTRILEEMSSYDDNAYSKLYVHDYKGWTDEETYIREEVYDENDENVAPVPFIM